jgi:hypothetical protein
MIIQPNIKKINQLRGKHNHTHNHMKILKKHFFKENLQKKNYTKWNGTR